jgi:hypothetical protein
MMKTWLKNESTIAKHGMVPITRNSSLGIQNPRIQNFVYISLVYIDKRYHLKSHSGINNLTTKN